jgi:hypothetical protein
VFPQVKGHARPTNVSNIDHSTKTANEFNRRSTTPESTLVDWQG